MIKVPSFDTDHTTLEPGLYLREVRNLDSGSIYIWDLRMVPPTGNKTSQYPWKPISISSLHVIEHLMAYKLRYLLQDDYIGFYVYGCRTGCALITRPLPVESLACFLVEVIDFSIPILSVDEVPAFNYVQCGNPKSINLQGASTALNNYLKVLLNQFPDIDLHKHVL